MDIVNVDGNPVAVIGSSVTTCNDMKMRDNSKILAAGMAIINIAGDEKGMNILTKLNKQIKDKTTVRTVFGEETYCFSWNAPALPEDIQAFEKKNECKLPERVSISVKRSGYIQIGIRR